MQNKTLWPFFLLFALLPAPAKGQNFPTETELRTNFRDCQNDPRAKYDAGSQLLDFYENQHDYQKASGTAESVVAVLETSARKRGFLEDKIPTSFPNNSAEEREREWQQSERREERNRLREEEVRSAREAKDLSDAAIATLEISRLYRRWSTFSKAQGYESDTVHHLKLAEQYAKRASTLFCKEGIGLYRSGQPKAALSRYTTAFEVAPMDSREQMAAADNAILIVENLGDKDQLWKTKRTSYLLHKSIENAPISDGYDGETPLLAEENSLIKHGDKTALLAFYETQHQFEKAKRVVAQILESLQWNDAPKVTCHRNWANFCETEKHLSDAQEHRKLADVLETKQIVWRKHDEEIRRKRRAEQERRDEAERRAEDARRAARSKEEEQKRAENFDKFTQQLQQKPDLSGKTFGLKTGTGGQLSFVDRRNVDIHLNYTETVGGHNFGDLPSIVPGSYDITGEAPSWKIRITSTLKGSDRVDNYSMGPGNDGVIILLGGDAPYPTVISGRLD